MDRWIVSERWRYGGVLVYVNTCREIATHRCDGDSRGIEQYRDRQAEGEGDGERERERERERNRTLTLFLTCAC